MNLVLNVYNKIIYLRPLIKIIPFCLINQFHHSIITKQKFNLKQKCV